MLLNTRTDANVNQNKQFMATFPDISLTAFKIPDISRFSRQVVTLLTVLLLSPKFHHHHLNHGRVQCSWQYFWALFPGKPGQLKIQHQKASIQQHASRHWEAVFICETTLLWIVRFSVLHLLTVFLIIAHLANLHSVSRLAGSCFHMC